ncbi:MAG: bifunctional homocysteine S-methyltransferase/methylenetetrahydrofolate reductase [Nitrospinota bacterium]|nr:bifunctional homocysteine S-methyltransferase/methylenetetrahydrofolate reductase [Nitrospinota bacterium]
MKKFREALKENILVCDGAMGTLIYQKGEYINRSYDQVNLTKPELIREIHREYISAGVDIIETNSFGANRFSLGKHGLESQVREINLAAASNATYEARGAVFVAGAVGPLGSPIAPFGKISHNAAFDAFKEQISALIEGGVDLIIFETFLNTAELEIAIGAARSVKKDIAIIAQMTFNEESATPVGEPAEKVAKFLENLKVDVIGANCSVGPAPMLETLERLASSTELPISAMPNAGNPHLVDGRHIYMTTPEYLVTYAKRYIRTGVKIVGGCCGTTPQHIKLIHNTVKALSPSRISVEARETQKAEPVDIVPTAEKSNLAKKLSEGKFITCVEILPPKGSDPAKTLEKARKLKDAGVDAVNIPDGPRASARMSPMSLAHLFRQDVGIEPVLHYTCRDRNLLGMQSDILGAHAVGLHNILAVTGDPPKLGNYPNATAVYDVDAIGLVRLINNLNHGLDVAGNPIGKPTAIHIGVGVNPVAINIEEEIRRLYQKVENGAEYIFTQPIFDSRIFIEFRERTKDIKVPFLIGILPISSVRMAEFLHNEVPGMKVPDEVMKRLESAGEHASEEGIKIAVEALDETRDIVHGAYVMAPGGAVKPALAVLEKYLPE